MQSNDAVPPQAEAHDSGPDLSGYALDFSDDFTTSTPDPDRWLPTYLPQWSTPERAAARCRIVDGRLCLVIDADQPAWAPEIDGAMRVSNLQTAVRSGPAGSHDGQHRFRPDLRVRSAQHETVLYAPGPGVVETTFSALLDPTCMVALWLIGLESSPEQSAEVCVAEVFGRDADAGSLAVGMGVHPFHDPRVTDDFAQVRVSNPAAPHRYAVERLERETRFFVDGRLARTVPQGITYPMQLMLSIYEFPDDGPRRPAHYPKVFRVDHVRGYRPEVVGRACPPVEPVRRSSLSAGRACPSVEPVETTPGLDRLDQRRRVRPP